MGCKQPTRQGQSMRSRQPPPRPPPPRPPPPPPPPPPQPPPPPPPPKCLPALGMRLFPEAQRVFPASASHSMLWPLGSVDASAPSMLKTTGLPDKVGTGAAEGPKASPPVADTAEPRPPPSAPVQPAVTPTQTAHCGGLWAWVARQARRRSLTMCARWIAQAGSLRGLSATVGCGRQG